MRSTSDQGNVRRGSPVASLHWHAVHPAEVENTARSSLSRRNEGAEAQPAEPVDCDGQPTEVPAAPANASYVNHQLNVLERPYVEGVPEPYLVPLAEVGIRDEDPDDSGTASTEILTFEASIVRVMRDDVIRREWDVRNVGCVQGKEPCSLTRRCEGEVSEVAFPITCQRRQTEAPAAPVGARYVRCQLDALEQPHDPADPHVSPVVSVGLATPDADPDAEPDLEPAPSRVSVSLQPRSVTLEPGETTPFTATVTGSTDTLVSWHNTCGDLASTAATVPYTVRFAAGACSFVETSADDASASDSATVTVTEGTDGIDVTRDGVLADAPQGGSVGCPQPRSTFDSSERMWLNATVTNSGTRSADGAWQRVEDRPQPLWRIADLPPAVTERPLFARAGAFPALREQALEVGVARLAGGALPLAIATSVRAVVDVVVAGAVLEVQITSAVTVPPVYAHPSAEGSDPHGYASLKRSSGRCGFDACGDYGADSGTGDHRWANHASTVTGNQCNDLLDTVIDVRTGGGTPLCSYRLAGTRRSAVLDLSACGGGPTGAITYRVGRDDGTRSAFGSQQAAHVMPRSATVSPSARAIWWPIVDSWQFQWDPGGSYPSGTTASLRMHTLGPGDGGQPQRSVFRTWGPTVNVTSGFLDGLDVTDDTHDTAGSCSTGTSPAASRSSYSLSDKALACRAQGSSDGSNCWFAWFADRPERR